MIRGDGWRGSCSAGDVPEASVGSGSWFDLRIRLGDSVYDLVYEQLKLFVARKTRSKKIKRDSSSIQIECRNRSFPESQRKKQGTDPYDCRANN
jgi:hypothetical protein